MVRFHSPLPEELPRLLRTAIGAHSMIRPGDRVLVAVSGGSDSMALLHLLARESARLGFEVAAGHFDHGLRSGSGEDARFVQEAAGRLGIPFHPGAGDVRGLARAERRCIEDAARAARHRFLRATLQSWGGDRIALGHQADDLCEGVLLRLVEGTGLAGLAGMKPVRGPFIRPLLTARREQIRAWLVGEGIAWREDESNASVEPRRNRMRHRLLPFLAEQFNPAIVTAVQRMTGILREEDAFLDDLVSDWLSRHAPRRSVAILPGGARDEDHSISLPRAELARIPRPLQRRILRRCLHEAGLSPRLVRLDQIETIVRLLESRRTGSRVTLARGFTARIEREVIRLGSIEPIEPAPDRARSETGAQSETDAAGEARATPAPPPARPPA